MKDMKLNNVKQEDQENVNDKAISWVGLNLSDFVLINVLDLG